jgi:cytochrome c
MIMIKKVFACVALTVALASCGGDSTPKKEEAPKEEAKKEDPSSNPDYQKGLALIGQSDCLTCHKVSEASTGPAYSLVANKYAGAADTTITRLARKIIDGGAGAWGAVPMTPHPSVSEEDAVAMVKYVLLLKK